jgi:chondroitin AC lyase
MLGLDVVRTRLCEELLSDLPDPLEAQSFADELAADGTWPDIDYGDDDALDWKPWYHVYRALQLALVEQHQAGALKALDAWRRLGLRCPNWWYNELGVPQSISDALLLLRHRLDAHERGRWGQWLADCAGPVKMTGANLVGAQSIVLRHGLLVDDPDLVSSAVTQLSSALRPTEDEGIQDDFSFHQHGALLYSGGYGSAKAVDLAFRMYTVHGTPWAFNDTDVRFLTDFLLDGLQWAVHGGGYDFTTMGRDITRQGAHCSTRDLRAAVRQLLTADAPRREELITFEARLAAAEAGRPGRGPVGCRYYPRSDYLVHRRPTWSITVRMSSTRTIPTESMHGENLRGRHLGDGVAALRIGDGPQDGYRAVIPLWNWARLPGITAEQPTDPAALFPRPNDEHGASDDVAGWTDGRHSIALMRLAGTDRFTEGWKAWFCFDDMVVALGAGITTPAAEHPVITTLDQRLVTGPVTMGPDPARPRYVHHGQIGYVTLDRSEQHRRVFAGTKRHTGSWSDITREGSSEKLSAEVFSIGFNHGPRPDGASYACLILLDTDAAATVQRSTAPGLAVLANTAEVQSVRCHRTGVTLTARHDTSGISLGLMPAD